MSKVDFAKGPYTITSTVPETKYYKYEGNIEHCEQSTSGFWDDNSKGPISAYSKEACSEKTEEIKPSDVPYEEYMKIVHENEVLKHIIVELNKQLYRDCIRFGELEPNLIEAIEKDLAILKIIKDNFIIYKDLYHNGKWQLILKQKTVFVEGSKEYELLKEWLND